MKRILSAVLTAALAGCGGGGGGGGGGNVRVDDPTGVQAELDAVDTGDGTAVLLVTEGGRPVFEESESLSARDRAAADAGSGRGNATLTRAGERGGLPHYVARVSGSNEDGITLTFDGYGAWGEYQAFQVVGIAAEGVTVFVAGSSGRFSESNPVGEGTATWRGAMIGESGDKFLSGDSTLVYDFSSATVDVRMTGIRDWNTPQTYPDMVWSGLDVRNGTFTDVRTIRGSFYGPNHEEAGGVFDRGAITGAFGAKREGE